MDTVAEKQFFSGDGVQITNTRAVFKSKTFSMANITSIDVVEKEQSSLPPLLIVIGIVTLIIGLAYAAGRALIVVGLTLAGGSMVYISTFRPTYYLMVASAGGDIQAYETLDKDLVFKIRNAITDAMVERG